MKNLLLLLTVLIIFSNCSSGDKGELVGVRGKKWRAEKPFGMVLVPSGAFVLGSSDDDPANVGDAPTKTVTVPAFYMDDTEITNSEYREFVEWVKDSVIRMRLAIMAEDNSMKSSGNSSKKRAGTSIGDYAFKDSDPETMNPYDKYMYENYYSFGTDDDPYAGRKLNKDILIPSKTSEYPDEYFVEVMDSMYIPLEESYNGQRIIDVNKLVFRYTWIDSEAAARKKAGKRSEFVKTENLKIYPDTTSWIKDFSYSYNEPMHNSYFWHSAYDDYPVVGVSWHQAKAFCAWRTLKKNSHIKKINKKKKKLDYVNNFRLPSEAEWEYAARGGLEGATYPWGSLYTKNDRGCFLANFKPNRGDYAADGALYTVEAKSYDPNGYKLYNMAGNVSEWTNDSYDAASYEFTSTLSPSVNSVKNERKVIRGGSWKDVAYFLKVSARDYEYADTARSYIGFRTVQDYMGPDQINSGGRARSRRR